MKKLDELSKKTDSLLNTIYKTEKEEDMQKVIAELDRRLKNKPDYTPEENEVRYLEAKEKIKNPDSLTIMEKVLYNLVISLYEYPDFKA